MSVRSAMLLSLGERYTGLIVGVVSSMVIARLLAPSDIGTFSVAMVALSFISAFRDFGVTVYVMQTKTLTTEDIRSAFTAQLLLGIGIALIIAVLSVPAAAFYGDPRIRSIFLVIALNYVVQPFGTITQAWLAREVRFGPLAVINLSSSLLSATASIVLAFLGHGPMSLALGNLTGIVVATAVSMRYRPAHFPWRPGVRNLRGIIKVGSQTSGLNLVNNLGSGAPELLIGKLQSLAAVGLFSRAQGLVSMFSRLITESASRVSLSFFAVEWREGRPLGPSFVHATTCITAIGWVFCLTLFGLADPIVRLMYGPHWTDAVPLLRLLAVGLALAIPATFVSPALTAVGALTPLLHATAAGAAAHLVLFAVASPFGLLATGWAAVASGVLHSAIFLGYTRRTISFSARSMTRGLLHSALVATVAAAGPAMVCAIWGLQPSTLLVPLVLGVSVTASGFIVALLVTRHPLGDQLRPVLIRAARHARA